MQNFGSSEFQSSEGASNLFSNEYLNKYHELVPSSFFKKLQSSLFHVFLYMIEESHSLPFLHSIIMVIRSIQYIGNVLFSSYSTFHDTSSASYKLINIISVFYNFCPNSYVISISGILSYIYGIIFIFFLVALIALSYIYKEKAVLPISVNTIMVSFVFSFGYILHPMIMNIFGQVLGLVIMGKDEESLPIRIVHLFFIITGFGIDSWLMITVFPTNLLFRLNSMPTLFWFNQVLLFEISAMITFFIAFGSHLSQIPRIICLLIGACLYLWNFFQIKWKGGFLNSKFNQFFDTMNYLSIGACLIHIILDLNNIKVNEIYFFSFIVLGICTFFMTSYLTQKAKVKHLQTLDRIEESHLEFDFINSKQEFYSVLLVGFQFVHPSCISWTYHKHAINKWPTDEQIWISFTKFVAIYPEEVNTFYFHLYLHFNK